MSRYDSHTTTFSPEGRLYQVEYAVEGIAKAPIALGLLTTEGIVFATERRLKGPLAATERPAIPDISGDKVFKLDEHISVAVAGLTSDANVLLDHARVSAQRHRYTYQEPIPAEDLVQMLCDIKQGYTQFGSVRPFGVAFLLGAWDAIHGFQLYHTDPSGNYSAWKAYAIGNHDGTAQGLLKQDWNEKLTLHQGLTLALKVLGKTLDAVHLTTESVEVATLERKPKSQPRFHILKADELQPLLAEAEAERQKEEEEREARRKDRAAAP
jgi:20S proteasome subunit alpha 3